ncbi:MAG TPA: class I SAM-dependent methyltransferase [Acidimicrobiales bacterium]|nr:class I SAM-dependent methyltransferase [Acidimicrobiales bacterium]
MNPEHFKLCSSQYWYDMLRDSILPWVIGSADLGQDVLEVGPGPGLTTDLLRDRVAALTAVEFEDELAAFLSARLAGTNVGVVHADATALPFEDGRFTGAASFAMIHHVPTSESQDQLFSEVARVLQPGGVFATFDGMANPGTAALHARDGYNPVDPSTLESRLLAAGFASVELQIIHLGWAAKARVAA